jgi:FkbM family methyltransferase
MIARAFEIFRNYGALPLSDRIANKLLGRPLLPNSYYASKVRSEAPFNYNGVQLPVDSPVFSDEVLRRFYWGIYESHEMEAIAQHLNSFNSFIDLGSCTGFLSAFAESLRPNIEAVAVEANPDLIPVINRTKQLNDANYEVKHAAYHPTAETVTFYQHSLAVGGSVQRATERSVDTTAISLAELIKENEFNNPVITCDIEGGEIGLIQEELNVILTKCPLLIIEMHDFADGVTEASRCLRESNLKLVNEFKINNPNSILVYRNPGIPSPG